MKSLMLICDIIETMEHYFNCQSIRDTILILVIGTFMIQNYEWIPLLGLAGLMLIIMYNFATNSPAPVIQQDKARAFRFLAKVMRQVSDVVEFLYLFVDQYIFWGHRQKTMYML